MAAGAPGFAVVYSSFAAGAANAEKPRFRTQNIERRERTECPCVVNYQRSGLPCVLSANGGIVRSQRGAIIAALGRADREGAGLFEAAG